MRVVDILSSKGREVINATAAASVADAVGLLAEHRIGALVIIEGTHRIAGILSERDVVRALAASGVIVLDKPVAAIMTRDVVTCSEADTINEVMARMTGGRFRHLPVVTNGRLSGIVSIGDVVKARIREIEREAEEIRSYITTA